MNRPSSLQARPRLSSPASLRRHMCQGAWRVIIYVGLYSVSLVNRKVTPQMVSGDHVKQVIVVAKEITRNPEPSSVVFAVCERTFRTSDGFARKDSHSSGGGFAR